MKIVRWSFVLAVMCVALSSARAQEARIVFIDLDRVFHEYYKTQLADAQLQERAEEFNEERRTMMADYEAMEERLAEARIEAQDSALSEEARSRKRDEVEDLVIEIRDFQSRIQRFDQTRRKQLEDQSRRMRTRIVNEIQEEIQTYARNQGYHVVVDSSGQSLNAVELILYVDARYDISDAVIELLNQGR